MTELIPDDGGQGTRRGGTFMIAAGWLLAIVVLTMLFGRLLGGSGNPNTAKAIASQEGPIVLQADRAGMYRAEGLINGHSVEFLLDTGATAVAVPLEVAEDAGMRLGARTQVETANGVTSAWYSRIDSIEIGTLTIADVPAVVVENLENRVLLGMTALRGLDFTHSGGELELRPAGG